ncbi:MAG: hypothetical protein ACFFC1_14650 [Promethearchaeota archaeon]
MSLWKVIAKTELRRRTSGYRNHRTRFFIAVYFLLLVWAFLGAPILFNIIIQPIVGILPDEIIIPGIGLVIEFLLMMFFLVLLTYPIQNIYRKTEIGYKEIVLASPVTAGDIFLGEFIGKLPIYLAFILIFAPILISIINPIIGLNLVQYLIIYSCIIGMVFFAALVGSIIITWMEHKIAKSERARDLGKAMIFLMSILMVAVMYFLIFLFNQLLLNPELKNYFMFYPSFWFSNIILNSIEPSLISTYILNLWTSLLLAIFVPLIVLYISFKKADSFFTLEGGIEKTTTVISKENIFYLFIRKTIGAKWGGLVVTQFKQFFRKKESIMKLVYVVGLSAIEGIVFFFIGGGELDQWDIAFNMLIIVVVIGMLFAIMVGNYIFVGSKDLLWVYKKSPRSVHSLVYSYMRMLLIIDLFMSIGFTILFSLVLEYDLLTAIFFFFFTGIYNIITVSQAVGIQCLRPSFEEKGGDIMINTQIIVGINIGIIIFDIIFSIQLISALNPPPEFVKIYFALPILILGLGIATPLMFYGLKNLKKLE